MGIAWDMYGQIFEDMDFTEAQVTSYIKNNKAKILPYFLAQRQAVKDNEKGRAVLDAIIEKVGAQNAGGYHVIALNHGVPESHAQELDKNFMSLAEGLNDEGALD